MKRFLSWVVLVLLYLLFLLVVDGVVWLFYYLLNMYVDLTSFQKVLVIILGGSTLLGLIMAPLVYGIPATIGLTDAINVSKKGARYIALGIIVLIMCVYEMVTGFAWSDILLLIYGGSMIIMGINRRKEGEV